MYVNEKRWRGRSKKWCGDVVTSDFRKVGVSEEDARESEVEV